jgi:predicted glycogen debranching enzyme
VPNSSRTPKESTVKQSWRDEQEWLETDGLGGFASGTVGGIRTRKYHGLLLAATQPPTGRYMLVNGVEVTVTTTAGTYSLSSQRYAGDVIAPEGYRLLESFDTEPWPTWRFKLPDGTVMEQELFMRHGVAITSMSWRIIRGGKKARLSVRPLFSGRDYHAMHHENPAFRIGAAELGNGKLAWRPYAGLPSILAFSNGRYSEQPIWYRQFHYQQEWLRGFDASEDLAAPGTFEFDLSAGDAVLIFAAQSEQPVNLPGRSARECIEMLRDEEMRRRRQFAYPLGRAADQYLVRRGDGLSIIAGYPWFADWGRDTFISIRGLLIATKRFFEARQVLIGWARHVRIGMLPNRFPDLGEAPEYNSVDASLWYVIAVKEFIDAAERGGWMVTDYTKETLLIAVDQILRGYEHGTRHGIRMTDDGLLAAGEEGVQLTWMDARVGDREITPRIGKPVEIQALWLNALSLWSDWWPRLKPMFERGLESFRERFWNERGEYLFDVVDNNHLAGRDDATFRPNQIFAVGGLPLNLLEPTQARHVVDQVERRLWTPLGLRSLDPADPQYRGVYHGNSAQRDAVYHQGTVWPYLIGAFVEAWVRVRGNTNEAKRAARRKFLAPLMKHLNGAGLGHTSEIADGDAPHMPRGCPFQAWSIGELLRLEQQVLADSGVEVSMHLNPARAPQHQTVG